MLTIYRCDTSGEVKFCSLLGTGLVSGHFKVERATKDSDIITKVRGIIGEVFLGVKHGGTMYLPATAKLGNKTTEDFYNNFCSTYWQMRLIHQGKEK